MLQYQLEKKFSKGQISIKSIKHRWFQLRFKLKKFKLINFSSKQLHPGILNQACKKKTICSKKRFLGSFCNTCIVLNKRNSLAQLGASFSNIIARSLSRVYRALQYYTATRVEVPWIKIDFPWISQLVTNWSQFGINLFRARDTDTSCDFVRNNTFRVHDGVVHSNCHGRSTDLYTENIGQTHKST